MANANPSKSSKDNAGEGKKNENRERDTSNDVSIHNKSQLKDDMGEKAFEIIEDNAKETRIKLRSGTEKIVRK